MHLVCDPPPDGENVEYYVIVGLPGDPHVYRLINDEGTDYSKEYGFKCDLSDVPAGSYDVMVSACNAHLCSLAAPFTVELLGKPSAPTGLRLL